MWQKAGRLLAGRSRSGGRTREHAARHRPPPVTRRDGSGARGRATLAAILVATATPPAQRALEATGHREVLGSLLLCGGGRLPHEITDTFLELAGGQDARIVVIPTAGSHADGPDPKATLDRWRRRTPRSLVLLHTRSRDEADRDAFVAPLTEATAVWIDGGSQQRLARVYRGTKVETELAALLGRGGVIGGTSAGVACMSKVMIVGGTAEPRIDRGLDLLPGAIIDQHYTERSREPRLRLALHRARGRWGLGIDEGTAVLVQGRRLRVLGRGKATTLLPRSDRRAVRRDVYRRGQVADLVALQRAARARAGPVFPPDESPAPNVAQGTLILVGGGRIPPEVWRRFLDAAGGPKAPIVVVPTAMGRRVPSRVGSVSILRRAGAENVTVWHADRRSILADPAFLEPLRRAKGIWFTGGRQWRLVDRYAGTRAERLFHDVLGKGGVIGGSSAGTSIQADYLVRGNPLGNTDMMAEGYEHGFGFLPGCAVDQHFAQRRRYRDMTAVMRCFPQLLGLGIDEGTAIVVQKSSFEVIGTGNVAVYDWSGDVPAGEDGRDHVRLGAGMRYDMRARKLLVTTGR